MNEQCSEMILVARKASDLYQNGVEMQLARRSAQCAAVASITVNLLGQDRHYCATHGEQRREMAAQMATLAN